MSRFTVEESNLIGMYKHNSKRDLLEELHEAMIYTKEAEMKALVLQVIRKVEKMSEEMLNQDEFVLEEE